MFAPAVLIALAATQTAPAGATTTSSAAKDMHLRAIEAMEQAAKSAAAAAEAAQKAAEAAQKAAGVTPTPAAATGAAAPASWQGTVGLNVIWFQGNAKTLTLQTNIALEAKTEHWIWGAKATAAYGESTAPQEGALSEVTAFNAGVQLRGDRRFSETVTGYLAGGADFDRVKSIAYRFNPEAGASIMWLERKEGDLTKLQLRTDLAARYGYEQRRNYYPRDNMDIPSVETFSPRLGVAFRYALSKDITFTEDAEALPAILAPEEVKGRFLFNSLSKVSMQLTSVLAFNIAFDFRHDSKPAEGKEKTDTALTIGLQVGL
ncbi:DUF481 domain-containing protein [Myxococcota bacterium]|nr:DUF481 domain-containing protein [Myxococcota bacterium]